MKILELKKLIKNIPNDFEFEVEVQRKVPEQELKKRSYQYPYDTERCKTDADDYDIGWSDKKIKINIIIKQ